MNLLAGMTFYEYSGPNWPIFEYPSLGCPIVLNLLAQTDLSLNILAWNVLVLNLLARTDLSMNLQAWTDHSMNLLAGLTYL